MWVSDEAVAQVTSEIVVNREKKRAIQQMSTKELTKYLVRLYRLGFEAGADAIDKAMRQEAEARHADPEAEYEEVKADWTDVLRIISEVKGIGPKLTQAIDERLKEAMR